MEKMKPNILAVILIIIGIMFFILMFFNPVSDIALAIAGSGFLLSGFMQSGQARNSEQNKKQLNQIMAKLDEIRQELEKEEQPMGTGIAIADVITSGLKYYTEHMTNPEKEEKND